MSVWNRPIYLGPVLRSIAHALGRAVRFCGHVLLRGIKGIWWIFSDDKRAKTIYRILVFILVILSACGVISLDSKWFQLFSFSSSGTARYVPFLWRLP